MLRPVIILAAAASVVSLPFLFRAPPAASDWRPGDPVLVAVSPHNEAIRYEFARAFSRWHRDHYGAPVRLDWRVIGGTSEIARYLVAEYMNSFRSWWRGAGRAWPQGAGEAVVDRRLPSMAHSDNPDDRARWDRFRELHETFRGVDDASEFGCGIDVFFGGGEYDHSRAVAQGLTVPPWGETGPPRGLFESEDGLEYIPAKIGGEVWRAPAFFGNVVSTFGICYNMDRLSDDGVDSPPSTWDDLTAPAYFRKLGMADPTKSGSVAKAFELMLHTKCREAVRRAGFDAADIVAYEAAIMQARLPPGVMPGGVPAAYQAALEQGFLEGLRMIQLIGANARYFTDQAGKVPVDVGMGNATAGICIDFYGRFQAQVSRAPDGTERMRYVTPLGGSGVSCDPISLLRGAPHREIAVRFIEFVLSEEGQQVWTYKPGAPGGPEKFALRRAPIRREFYPSTNPDLQRRHEKHNRYAADDLSDPALNPYVLAGEFTYVSRWTGGHFNVLRDLVRAMCIDAGGELKEAWRAIIENGGPARQPEAMRLLQRLPQKPVPFEWGPALQVPGDRLDYLRTWTLFFRDSYGEARAAVVPVQRGGE